MARRNQGINVKVPRVKVIKALEQALVKLETNYTNQEANEAKHKAASERWQKQVIKLATTKFGKAENVRVNVRWNNVVTIDFDLPAGTIKLPEEPKKEFDAMAEWQYKDNKEEIENAIRVLKMCDDELISTATYGGITKYL
jgi:ATP-dependent protease HslVU (ClpYQ) ATPase subunit